MDTWRDRLPVVLVAAAGVLIVALLLIFRPDDTSTVLLLLSLAVMLLAVPVAAILLALRLPSSVVHKVVPAGVITGGVLLVAGMWLDSPWTLVTLVALELGFLVFWMLVALLADLWRRLVRRRRS